MKIDGKTRIYGVFGYPIKHSASPAMQAAAFASFRLNAVYLPFAVRPAELKKAVEAIIPLGLGGVNVTIPHKEKIIRFLDGLSPRAKRIGAVNTIVIRRVKLVGCNTDCHGFLSSLKGDLGFSPRGERAFVLGAGGAARAVAFALAEAGVVHLYLSDIIKNRASVLAANVRRHFPRCQVEAVPLKKDTVAEKISHSRLLVNATPVGMKPSDPLPVERNVLRPDLAVYDLVYNPGRTKLVKAARRAGAKAAGGQGMLVHQGAIAFRLWTGKSAPVALMRKALERHLQIKN